MNNVRALPAAALAAVLVFYVPFQSGAHAVALVGATIVDGAGGAPLRDGVIVIRDGRFAAVGTKDAVSIPADIERIDAANRFIIPGLIDLHVHFGGDGGDRRPLADSAWMLPTLLAFGVTTVKEAGAFDRDARPLKAALDSGARAGPRLISSGITINGDPRHQVFLNDPGDGREAVRRSVTLGADFIKIHNFIGPIAFDAIVDEAAQTGLRVTGHVPLSMTMREAVARGLYGLEHIRVRPEEVLDDPGIIARFPVMLPVQKRELFWEYVEVSSIRCRTLIDYLSRQPIYLDPTLVADAVDARHDRVRQELKDLPLPADVAKVWQADRYTEGLTARDFEAWAQALKRRQAFVAAAWRAGVLVTTGTDSPIPFVYPGDSLHRELALLVEAGLPAAAAIRAATIDAARALLREDFGGIQVGKRADLVVLKSDPLASISNTREILSVWKDGRPYDPATLRKEAGKELNHDAINHQ
jgi:imidazolonepropionase-like amidohydrolase